MYNRTDKEQKLTTTIGSQANLAMCVAKSTTQSTDLESLVVRPRY